MPTYHPAPATPKLNASERLAGRSGKGGGGHIAAIHVLKAKLGLSDEDYRALLHGQTGQTSCKHMSPEQLAKVRRHMQRLAGEAGAGWRRPDEQPRYVQSATPLERKVWALWKALGRAGKLDNPTPAGLQAWVRRQTGVDHLRWCKPHQLHALIESLKLWQGR